MKMKTKTVVGNVIVERTELPLGIPKKELIIYKDKYFNEFMIVKKQLKAAWDIHREHFGKVLSLRRKLTDCENKMEEVYDRMNKKLKFP